MIFFFFLFFKEFWREKGDNWIALNEMDTILNGEECIFMEELRSAAEKFLTTDIKVKFDEWNIIQAPPYIFHASNA